MSIKVGELLVELGADVARLRTDMGNAARVVDDHAKRMARAADTVKTALGGIAIGLSAGAVASFAKQAIDGAAALDDMAEATGASVESLSRFTQVAKIGGQDAGVVETAILRLSKAMAGVDEESKGAGEAFRKLGLNVAELRAQAPDKQFEAVAKAMNSFADGAGKTSIGLALYGKQWKEIAPLIKDYGDNLGIAARITAEQAAEAERLQKQFNALKLSVTSLAQEGILNLVQAFNRLQQVGLRQFLAEPLTDNLNALKARSEKLAGDMNYAERQGDIAEVNRLYGEQVALIEKIRRLEKAGAGDGKPQAPVVNNALGDFLGSAAVQSDAQRKLAERRKLLQEYAEAVKGVAQGTPDFNAALAALNQGLANIEEKGKKAAEAAKDLKAEWEHYTSRDLHNEIDMVKERNKAYADAEKAAAQQRDAYNQTYTGIVGERDALREANEALRERNEEIGLEGRALAELQATRIEALAVQKEQQAADLESVGIGGELVQLYREQAAALREKAQLTREGGARSAEFESARKAADEYSRIMDSIGSALTGSIMRGFEGGKSFARNFLDSVRNLFKTTVLRLAVQGVVTGVTGAAVNALTGGNANAAGLINGNSGGGSYGNLGTSLATNGISSAFGGTAGLVSAGASLFAGTSFGAFGAGLAGGLSSFGSLSATTASIGAAGTGTAAGFGYALGAIAPYLAIIAVAISALAKGGTPHAGAVVFGGEGYTASPRTQAGIDAFYADPRQNQQFHESDFTKRYNADVAKALDPLAANLATQFNSITRKYGLGGGYTVGVGFSADGDDKSRGRFSILDAGGREVTDFLRRFSRDASKGMEQFGLAAQQGLLAGLRELDLGAEVNAVLDKSLSGATDYLTKLTQEQTTALLGLLDTGLLDDLVKNVDLAALSFDDLNARIAQLARISSLKPLFDNLGISIVEVGVDIVAAMGSIENASNAMQAYYAAFYTDSERLGIAQSQLAEQFKALNVAVPASKAAFRALVDGLDLSTASGRQLWASLLQIAPAFAEISDAAQQAAQEQIDAQNAAAEAARQAAQQTRDAFRDVTKSLKDFLASLKSGPYSDLGPEAQYAAAKAAFDATGKRAALGDLAAMQSLQGVAQQFLEASRGWFASSAGYSADLAAVEALLQRVIGVGTRSGVRGYASGGTASGLFMAGEAGPELIYSAAPVRVLNAGETRSALDPAPIVAAIDRGTRANTDALARLETRLARLERTSAEQAAELRLRNAA